jgi:hypothetical protein
MSQFSDIISQVTGALAGNKEDKAGLYGLLFGNKQIPVIVTISPDTQIILLIAMSILAAGAVATGYVLKR